MTVLKWMIFLLFLLPSATAWTIDNPNYTFQITNANITFPTNQTYDSIQYGANYIILNGSTLQIIPTAQINVTINQYQTLNNYYNISLNGTADAAVNHVPSTSGTYQFFINSIDNGILTTVGGVLYSSYSLNGLQTIVWYLVPTPISEIACLPIQNDINTAFTFIGVLLILVSAFMIIQMLYTKSFSGVLIISAIGMTTVGSIMMLVGYYLVVVVEGVTC